MSAKYDRTFSKLEIPAHNLSSAGLAWLNDEKFADNKHFWENIKLNINTGKDEIIHYYSRNLK